MQMLHWILQEPVAKAHLHREKTEEKISFDVCRLSMFVDVSTPIPSGLTWTTLMCWIMSPELYRMWNLPEVPEPEPEPVRLSCMIIALLLLYYHPQ